MVPFFEPNEENPYLSDFYADMRRWAPPPSTARFPVRWTKELKLTGLDALPAALAEELKPNNAPLDLHIATGPITTCAGHLAAFDGGAEHASSTFEMAQESFFKQRCLGLWFVKEASPSATSHIAELRLDRKAMALLHPNPFELPAEYEDAVNHDGRLAALPGMRGKKATKESVTYVDPKLQLEVDISLIAWGDIDHDGAEDVFSMVSTHALDGSYRSYSLVLLTQTSESGKLTVLRTLD